MGPLPWRQRGEGTKPEVSRAVKLNKAPTPSWWNMRRRQRGDAFLRLYWTNSETPRNPIPLSMLTPATNAALATAISVRTDATFGFESRCVRCHVTSGTAPELSMDAPDLQWDWQPSLGGLDGEVD